MVAWDGLAVWGEGEGTRRHGVEWLCALGCDLMCCAIVVWCGVVLCGAVGCGVRR